MRARLTMMLLVLVAVIGLAVMQLGDGPGPAPRASPMWTVDTDAVQSLAIARPGVGSALFRRQGHGWGGGEDIRVNAALLLLEKPEGARLVSSAPFEAGPYGLDAPTLVVTLVMADGATVVIRVGSPTPDGRNRYVLAPAGDAVHAVPASWHDALAQLVPAP